MLLSTQNHTRSGKTAEYPPAAVVQSHLEFSAELLDEPEDRKAPAVSAVFQALKRVEPTPTYRAALRRRQRRRERAANESSSSRPSSAASFLNRIAKSLAFWRN